MSSFWSRGRVRALACTVAVTGVLATSACAESGGAGPTGGPLPPTIKIALIKELTGSAGFAGTAAKKGVDLAVDEINTQKFLGDGVRIEVDTIDTASNTQTAATDMAKAVSGEKYTAVLGPSNSDAGQATAPLAQRGKVPLVFSQSLGDGVLVGDFVFRVTSPVDAYEQKLYDVVKARNIKTVSVLFNSSSPRQIGSAQQMAPRVAAENGVRILSSAGVPVTSTDFTAAAAQIAAEKPDAVQFFMAGAQHVSAVQQLRRAGYQGQLIGDAGIETSLGSVGPAAEGILWAADYSYLWTYPSATAFTKSYTAKYGDDHPLTYAAEGYDSLWWIARALKEAGSADRAKVRDGLAAVARTGFDGAQGKVTFEGNDARVEGVVCEWVNGKITVLDAR